MLRLRYKIAIITEDDVYKELFICRRFPNRWLPVYDLAKKTTEIAKSVHDAQRRVIIAETYNRRSRYNWLDIQHRAVLTDLDWPD